MLLREISMAGAMINIRHAGETKDHKFLGKGAQSYVALKKSRPNAVVKLYGFNTAWDPYLQFLALAEQNQNNPFFPRIYRNIRYKRPFIAEGGRRWKHSGVVEMEELIPLKSFDRSVINGLLTNLGFPEGHVETLYNIFMTRAKIHIAIQRTPNQQFAEALKVLLSTNERHFDLHHKNWMIRPTSIGPQLVITDPAIPDQTRLV